MKLVPEKVQSWHKELTEKYRLLFYGVLGNLVLTGIDTSASLAGGQGSVVNGLHNLGDAASYGLRALVASDKLSEKTSRKILLGANLLALSLTVLFTVKSGVDLAYGNDHLIETSAGVLALTSSAGNFAIASALKDAQGNENYEHRHEGRHHAMNDGHHHARTDARASLIGAGGLSLATVTGDNRFDSIGAFFGGIYFIAHMLEHMRSTAHKH